ncbi:hypothetical protein Cgig2_014182 [Carnegiea gigantea]|uniref:Uncharacterized protein n=1 Tax=Carnegiea gigantea TaxID=171969 RepID=A0A9Q1K758_9CARY|nr:hypothetical protein Cgig2_014182 [Carnegiea gigantea]
MMSSSLPCTLPVWFQQLLNLASYEGCVVVCSGSVAQGSLILALSHRFSGYHLPIPSTPSTLAQEGLRCLVAVVWVVSLTPHSVRPARECFDLSHRLYLHLNFSILISLTLLTSCSSATESLSPTNSKNGDNDNLNQDPTPSSAAQSKYPHSMGRSGSDHPCNPIKKGQASYAKAMKFGKGCNAHSLNPCPEERIDSPLPPAVPLLAHSHQIEVCPDLPLQSKVEIVVEKFRGASEQSSVKVNHPSSFSNEPVTTTDKWIRVSAKKRLRSMTNPGVGKPCPLKPTSQPKVTVVDPAMSPNNIGSPSLVANHGDPDERDPSLHTSLVTRDNTILLA